MPQTITQNTQSPITQAELQSAMQGASMGQGSKISTGEKLGSFGVGVLKSVVGMAKGLLSVKGIAGMAAMSALCAIPVVGPIAITLTAGLGVVKGLSGFIEGAERASNATTAEEAKAAWENMGGRAFMTGMSAVALNAGIKGVRKAGTNSEGKFDLETLKNKAVDGIKDTYHNVKTKVGDLLGKDNYESFKANRDIDMYEQQELDRVAEEAAEDAAKKAAAKANEAKNTPTETPESASTEAKRAIGEKPEGSSTKELSGSSKRKTGRTKTKTDTEIDDPQVLEAADKVKDLQRELEKLEPKIQKVNKKIGKLQKGQGNTQEATPEIKKQQDMLDELESTQKEIRSKIAEYEKTTTEWCEKNGNLGEETIEQAEAASGTQTSKPTTTSE